MTAIGILAEDESDCDAFKELIVRIRRNRSLPNIAVKARSTQGCAKLVRKARAKLSELSKAGCDALILVHDLDRNPENNQLRDEQALRNLLSTLMPVGVASHICIPVEELEAWFWSDQQVLTGIAPGAKAVQTPHGLARPKEMLIRASRDAGKKPLYNTNKAKDLASILDLDVCAARCSAFRDFRSFVERVPALVPGQTELRTL